MDIEFHYYITYLIALKAGFNSEEAYIIAYSSQYVDNNDIIFEINRGGPQYYSNYISQTMNILKPKDKLFRIYPIFHFIPGEPLSLSARRKDGKLHFLNTTPNSQNAQNILKASLETGNLYNIGISCHAYADTWAHQNFVGYFDDFNAVKGLLENAIPKIGHAGAGHKPDWPALTWIDCRLVRSLEIIDNKLRFIEAAKHLFEKLRKCVMPTCSQHTITKDKEELARDISHAIGKPDGTNRYKKLRIERYKRLSKRSAYGNVNLKEYDQYAWLDEAINEDTRGMRDRSSCILRKFLPMNDVYKWKDIDNYKNTHWYKFQEAVKTYQNQVQDILFDTTFSKMELEKW